MLKRLIYNNRIMLTILCVLFLSLFTIRGMQLVKADEALSYDKSFVTIEIEEGDTLSSIAKEYALSETGYADYIAEVKSINNLKNNTIHAGCYLLVPVYNIH